MKTGFRESVAVTMPSMFHHWRGLNGVTLESGWGSEVFGKTSVRGLWPTPARHTQEKPLAFQRLVSSFETQRNKIINKTAQKSYSNEKQLKQGIEQNRTQMAPNLHTVHPPKKRQFNTDAEEKCFPTVLTQTGLKPK